MFKSFSMCLIAEQEKDLQLFKLALLALNARDGLYIQIIRVVFPF